MDGQALVMAFLIFCDAHACIWFVNVLCTDNNEAGQVGLGLLQGATLVELK